jgi:hypothetical protein
VTRRGEVSSVEHTTGARLIRSATVCAKAAYCIGVVLKLSTRIFAHFPALDDGLVKASANAQVQVGRVVSVGGCGRCRRCAPSCRRLDPTNIAARLGNGANQTVDPLVANPEAFVQWRFIAVADAPL